MSNENDTIKVLEATQRFNRLPKWAQREIENLKRDLADATKDAEQWKGRAVGVTDERTGVTMRGRWGEDDVRLPKHAQIAFETEGGSVTVAYDMYGRLAVNTVGTLLVSPRATNVVTVKVED